MIRLVILGIISMFSLLSLPVNASSLTSTFACDNCSYNQAKQIALQEASPAQSCTSSGGGPSTPGFGAPSICEHVEKPIIVASVENRRIFKFNVTVIPSLHNNEQVIISDLTPTENDYLLSTRFFNVMQDVERALTEASTFSASSSNKKSTLKQKESAYLQSSNNDWCSQNHPVDALRSIAAERALHNEITNDIKEKMGNQSWADFSHGIFVTGGSISVEKGAFGLGVSLAYYQKTLRVTKSYGTGNNLTFDLSVRGELENGNDKLEFGFKLNPLISRIDGIQVESLFRPNQVTDLWDTTMSNCWNDFVDDLGEEVDPHPSDSSGGSGTRSDPYYGPGSLNRSSGYCVQTVRICTRTSITDLDPNSGGTAPPACSNPVYFTELTRCGA